MPSSRPTYLEGEDIEFYVDIDSKYLTDYERLFAYAYFDDYHHLLTSTESEFIQMEPDAANSRVKIHIANAVTANPDIMPVGIWALEIMTVYNETEYRAIYQNLKQFEIKKSYIVFSGDVFINQNIKMAIQQLNHYRGETITFRFTGDDTYIFNGTGAQYFEVYVYPDGMNVSDPANKDKIIRVTSLETTPSESECYVEPVQDENAVDVIIPHGISSSDKMPAGKFTVELRYGDTKRSVILRNNAFTVIEAASELTWVSTPVIAGTTPFSTSTSVTITCSTPDASIYYTTDGSTPSISGTAYTQAITLNATTTIKAIAVKNGVSSTIATQTFTKNE